jgi:hypothetical protein
MIWKKASLGSSKGGVHKKKILIQSSFSLLRSPNRLIDGSPSGLFLSQRLINIQWTSSLFRECLLAYLQLDNQDYKNKQMMKLVKEEDNLKQ